MFHCDHHCMRWSLTTVLFLTSVISTEEDSEWQYLKKQKHNVAQGSQGMWVKSNLFCHIATSSSLLLIWYWVHSLHRTYVRYMFLGCAKISVKIYSEVPLKVTFSKKKYNKDKKRQHSKKNQDMQLTTKINNSIKPEASPMSAEREHNNFGEIGWKSPVTHLEVGRNVIPIIFLQMCLSKDTDCSNWI